MRLVRAVILVWACLAGPVSSQDAPTPSDLPLGQVRSPVLTVDLDRLYSESLFGQRAAVRLREAAEALTRENQEIEAALTEEERSLTERRPSMDVEEFRALAEDFDRRVQAIRDARDAKTREYQQSDATLRAEFFEAATPILAEIMLNAGAAVILDRRSVYLAVDAVDVTAQAIALVNERIGDGQDPAADDIEAEGVP